MGFACPRTHIWYLESWLKRKTRSGVGLEGVTSLLSTPLDYWLQAHDEEA